MASADAGWAVTILTPTERANAQALGAVAILALLIMLLGFGVAFYLQRRAQLLERIAVQRAATETLEARIAERTLDLKQANDKLVEEVRERRDAENRLRQTQTELIQAGKLAALGQMSAALSHEFNQPLAAIRSTADNARLFIEREKPERALSGLDRIVGMVERMAEISRILKGFSRRAGTDLKPTAVKPALDEAVMLLSPRLKQSGASLVIDPVDPSIRVLGGHVRLEQVLLNLVANALDAVEGRADGLVRVEVRTLEDGNVVIRVADNGPGIDADVMARVFDPFFTTKDVGKGLGLGLSIAYKIVHDFSGTLVAGAAPEGGAEFTVRLRAADAALDAAQ